MPEKNTNGKKDSLRVAGLWRKKGKYGEYLSGSIRLAQLEQLVIDATATGAVEFWLNLDENRCKEPGSKYPDLMLTLRPRHPALFASHVEDTEDAPW